MSNSCISSWTAMCFLDFIYSWVQDVLSRWKHIFSTWVPLDFIYSWIQNVLSRWKTYILNVNYSWLYSLMSTLFTLGSFWLSTELPMQMQGKITKSKKHWDRKARAPIYGYASFSITVFFWRLNLVCFFKHMHTDIHTHTHTHTHTSEREGAAFLEMLPKYGK